MQIRVGLDSNTFDHPNEPWNCETCSDQTEHTRTESTTKFALFGFPIFTIRSKTTRKCTVCGNKAKD